MRKHSHTSYPRGHLQLFPWYGSPRYSFCSEHSATAFLPPWSALRPSCCRLAFDDCSASFCQPTAAVSCFSRLLSVSKCFSEQTRNNPFFTYCRVVILHLLFPFDIRRAGAWLLIRLLRQYVRRFSANRLHTRAGYAIINTEIAGARRCTPTTASKTRDHSA